MKRLAIWVGMGLFLALFGLSHGDMTYAQSGETKVEGLKDGLKNGLKDGLKKGLQDGLKKGLKDGMKNGLKNGLKNGEKSSAFQGGEK